MSRCYITFVSRFTIKCVNISYKLVTNCSTNSLSSCITMLQRWTDDCDDSTQLDSYFLGAQKRLDSWFQTILALRSTIQLMILSELWQTGTDSTQFNSFMSFDAKCCKYTPLHICLNSFHLNLANQSQSSQLFDVAGTSESCIDFQWDEYKSIFYLCHCLPFTIGETISINFIIS